MAVQKASKKPAAKTAAKKPVNPAKKAYVAGKKPMNKKPYYKKKKAAAKPATTPVMTASVTAPTMKPIAMPDAIPSPAVKKCKRATVKKVVYGTLVAVIALAFILMVF